ncbi:hypothetical protein BC828DRAFT_381550 [Blastocladiella britannica]|nr:hypothetical protein BC828DRAFT_381550 [Blastocladiella britannica]
MDPPVTKPHIHPRARSAPPAMDNASLMASYEYMSPLDKLYAMSTSTFSTDSATNNSSTSQTVIPHVPAPSTHVRDRIVRACSSARTTRPKPTPPPLKGPKGAVDCEPDEALKDVWWTPSGRVASAKKRALSAQLAYRASLVVAAATLVEHEHEEQ